MARFLEDFPVKEGPQGEPALDPSQTTYGEHHIRRSLLSIVSRESCVVLFIGINDVLDREELPKIVERVLESAHSLHTKAGARNFVFIDVPPVDRAPEGASFNLASPSN